MNREEVEQAAERTDRDVIAGVCLSRSQGRDVRLLATSIPILFRALEKAGIDTSEFNGPAGWRPDQWIADWLKMAEAEIEKERQNG